MLTFGVTVLPDPPYTRLLELMQMAEERGFDNAWTYDSHILWHESYPLLALAAARTSTLRLGHCVTNPGIREPTVTASYYATLRERCRTLLPEPPFTLTARAWTARGVV